MATDKPEETTPAEPAIVSEAPKQRPWLKIAVIVVAVVVVIAAVAYLLWPRNRAPTISQAGVSSETAAVNQALTFTAQATDPDGNPLTYTWDFGDNSTGTGAEVTHAYAMNGKFIALLTVTDGQGGVVTNDNSLIFVQVSTLIAVPTTNAQTGPAAAVLSADRAVIEAGSTVNFNSNSSWAYVWSTADSTYTATFPADVADMFTSVVYTWYDGSTATSGNITTVGATSHTFTVPGNYLNKLTVTTAAGPTGTATATYGYTIRVQPAAPVIQVKNPDIFTEVTIGEPQYVDPAVDYETAGGEVLQNVYETLVWYQEGNEGTTVLVPRLATEVPTTANGEISLNGLNYTFTIRQNVKFQDGSTMTADDVVYSIQRVLWIHDPDGPSWMLEAIMTNYVSYYVGSTCGAGGTKTCTIGDWVNDSFAARSDVPSWMTAAMPAEASWDTTTMTSTLASSISNSTVVKVDANHVMVHLTHPYPAFLYIAAYTVMSIVPKAVVLAHGGDSWGNHNTWMDRHAVGTGPFSLQTWEPNQVIILTRWDQYWRTPAKVAQVNIVKYNDIASREFALFAGDADYAAIDRNYQYDIINQDKTVKYDYLNVTMDKPTFDVMFFGFNQNIDTAYVPSGFLATYAPSPTFYSDVHIRRAFSAAFDYNAFIQTVVYGGGMQARGPIPDGMLGYNASIPLINYDLTKTKAELALAMDPANPGHSYLEDGFSITLFYNAGNMVRQEGCQLLKTALESLNGQAGVGTISVNAQALDWPVYLSASQHRGLPLFFLGWAPDYADPDDYVVPFLYSTGTFALRQSYDNATLDSMIQAAASELNTTKREKMYEDLTAAAYLNDVPDIFVYQATNFHVQRAWVQGYWFNPMLSGGYFYLVSKG